MDRPCFIFAVNPNIGILFCVQLAYQHSLITVRKNKNERTTQKKRKKGKEEKR